MCGQYALAEHGIDVRLTSRMLSVVVGKLLKLLGLDLLGDLSVLRLKFLEFLFSGSEVELFVDGLGTWEEIDSGASSTNDYVCSQLKTLEPFSFMLKCSQLSRIVQVIMKFLETDGRCGEPSSSAPADVLAHNKLSPVAAWIPPLIELQLAGPSDKVSQGLHANTDSVRISGASWQWWQSSMVLHGSHLRFSQLDWANSGCTELSDREVFTVHLFKIHGVCNALDEFRMEK